MATKELTTSERVAQALDSYKKENPGETFNAQEVKDLIDGVEAREAQIHRKISAREIKDHAIPSVVENRKNVKDVGTVLSNAITPAGYAVDGGFNAQSGKHLVTQSAKSVTTEVAAEVAKDVGTIGAKNVAKALAGPIIGVGLVAVDAGIDAYNGRYKEAGINATSGIASIAAAAGTGALMGTVVPGAGNVAGFAVGAVVGAATYYGSKWGLSKIFNDAAKDESPAPAPVQLKPYAPQNIKTFPGMGANAG